MTPDRRFALYMTMAHLGALATLLLIGTLCFDWPDFVKGVPLGMLVISIATILISKLRDDYVEALWRSGVSAAFAAIFVCFVIAPLLVGFASKTIPPRMTIGVEWPAAIALAAFFVGFYAARLRGRA